MGWSKAAIFIVIGCLAILFGVIDKKGVAKIVDDIEKNPHGMKTERYVQMCNMCHSGDPHKAGRPIIPGEGLSEICRSCHQKTPLSCRMAVTAAVSNILQEQIPLLALNTRKGGLTCDSCHLVHGERGKGLKGAYFLFLKQAERINPHRAAIFCVFCHDKEPRGEEGPLNLKYKGSRVLICTQCHNNERARADNHPVNIYPSEGKGVKMDESFPLYEGKVTCVTCHNIRCQGGETNPKFIRGGPYKTRVDACLVCHQRERYQAVNPHEQIDEHGRLRKDRCLYCHIIGPASKN